MSDPAVALVTGATRGLGLQLARALARRNYTVYGAGRWPPEEEAPAPFHRLPLDVDDEHAVVMVIRLPVRRKTSATRSVGESCGISTNSEREHILGPPRMRLA